MLANCKSYVGIESLIDEALVLHWYKRRQSSVSRLIVNIIWLPRRDKKQIECS